MNNQEILARRPKDASHVSVPFTLNTPPTWLRYENVGEFSVWMDDGGLCENPYWRLMPNNCIEFPEYIRAIQDIVEIEQLRKEQEGE